MQPEMKNQNAKPQQEDCTYLGQIIVVKHPEPWGTNDFLCLKPTLESIGILMDCNHFISFSHGELTFCSGYTSFSKKPNVQPSDFAGDTSVL